MIEGKCGCGLSYAVRQAGNAVGYCALSIRCGTRDEAPRISVRKPRLHRDIDETGPHTAPIHFLEDRIEEFGRTRGRSVALLAARKRAVAYSRIRRSTVPTRGRRRKPAPSSGFHSGTAHFVEHTIFKGTARHNAASINSCLDRLGGELNAYTTKEEIVLHATFLKEDLRKAASLLFELVTCPTFPTDEVETERGVIIDEINSYKDAPAEEVYDLFEGMLFRGHPLSGPILGDVKSVMKITREELARFVREKFVPENMVFTVVADIDERVLSRWIEKMAARFFPDHPEDVFRSSELPSRWERRAEPFSRSLRRRNHQVNCVMGGTAPSLYDQSDRIAMVLLTNIIGGPASNSILNSILRERHGWVYGVECTYTQYADTGIVAISLGCEKDNLDKCLQTIGHELDKLRNKPLSEPRLKAAKKQLIGQIAVSGDNGENQCLSMGKSLLSYGHVVSDAEGMRQINAVSAADLQRLANLYLAPDRLSTLVLD